MLPQLSPFAVEYRAGDAVAPLAPVKLRQRATTLGFVIDIGKCVQSFVDPAKFGDGLGQSGRTFADLKRAHYPGSGHASEFERAGQAQHVVPMRLDLFQADLVSRYRIEQPIVGVGIDSPEARAANIGQARTESISKQPK